MPNGTAWRRVARLSSYGALLTVSLLLLVLPSARGMRASSSWNADAHPLPSLEVVLQSQPASCGPAALATLLGWLGRPQSEAHLLSLTELGPDGLSLAEFARLSQLMDVPGAWYQTSLGSLPKLRTPFVAHLELPGAAVAGHLVVVHSVSGDYIVVADPAQGGQVMALSRFGRDFSGRVYLLESAT